MAKFVRTGMAKIASMGGSVRRWYVGKADQEKSNQRLTILNQVANELKAEGLQLLAEAEKLRSDNKILQSKNADLQKEIDELKRK